MDGLHVHKQNSSRSTREVNFGIVHKGWEKKHPSINEYTLKNKSYWRSLDTGEAFWESFSQHLYSQYAFSKDTTIVINGTLHHGSVKVLTSLNMRFIPMTAII